MSPENIFNALQQNAETFRSLLNGLLPEQYRWKNEPAKWSVLEVVCHLYDEEREDFRARLRHVLETPDAPMSPIDPPGWVVERQYLQQSFEDKAEAFLKEREQSVRWLKSLENPNWENSHHHPKLGPMSASFILNNWLAHDYLHIRQITRLRYEYLLHTGGEKLGYAGNW